MLSKLLHCSTPSRNLNLTHVSAAPAEMKKKQERKKGFFPYGTNSDSGIPKDSARNCGISIMAKFKKAKMFVYFQSATGPNWMYGIIYAARKYICRRFIFLMKEM